MAKKIKISQLEEAKTLDGLWIFAKGAGTKNVRASMGLLRGNTAFVEWQGRNPGKTYADWIRLLQDPAFTAAEGVDLIKKNLTDFEAAAKEKEAARVQAETSRGTAEATRVEAENKRVTSESGRVTAEGTRDAAEKNRITKETARVKAETSRGTAEAARVKAENERVTSFDKIKTDAEAATTEATSAAEKGEALNNNPPKVIDDHWHAYDLTQKKYINTNVKARGEQGYDLVVLSNGNYGNYNRVTGKYDDSGVKASATVDIENVAVKFTEAAKKENITTGETIPVMLGKIRKWFSDGIGNVLASTTGLKKDARYLFSPKADGSAEGSFVELGSIGSANLVPNTDVNKDIQKYWLTFSIASLSFEKGSHLRVAKKESATNVFGIQTPQIKRLYKGRSYTATFLVRAVNINVINYNYIMSSLVGNQNIGNPIAIKEQGVFQKVKMSFVPVRDFSDSRMMISVTQADDSVERYFDISEFKLVEGEESTDDWQPSFDDKKDYNTDLENIPTKVSDFPNDIGYQTASDVKSAIDAKVSYLTGSSTITTLTNIPTTKRIILATLSAATNITLKEPLEVGKELLISINPTADFEQPLPVSGGWTSLDGDTLSLKANKPAELSILCVEEGKYVLSSKVAE